ncbi:MAG: ABC transporter ATP-binding protein [Treponema sp.]|jgi:NitT/TauT family transport system ATP-binding protein|nr:ABC transporter ATP-binding protein [Treponema sp.]
MIISIKNLSFGFGEKLIFKDFSLDIDDRGPTALLGASGCGKTTLLRLIAGLLKPSGAEPSRVIERGGDVSFIFQESRLLPWYTALENVCLPIEPVMGKAAARSRGLEFLRRVSLEDKAGAYPAELSGGQAQRVSFARAFACPAPIILMDEPFQALDIPLRIQLMETARSLLEQDKRLAVLVTHDPREAIFLGRRILMLGNEGRGIVYETGVDLPREDRSYGSPAQAELEARLMETLLLERPKCLISKSNRKA